MNNWECVCVIYPLLIFYVSQVGLQVDSPLDLCLGKGSRGSKTIRYHPSLNHKPCQLEITVFLWHFLFGRVRTLKEVKIPKKGYGKIQKGAFFFRKKGVHVFFFGVSCGGFLIGPGPGRPQPW